MTSEANHEKLMQIQACQHNIAAIDLSLQELKRSLSIQNDPEVDFNALRHRYTPGTCRSLLRDEDLIGWNSKTWPSPILWMHAAPGCGKSIKAAFLVDHYKSNAICCQYYFFKHEDTVKRTAESFFRSLAYQIAVDVPPYRTALAAALDQGHLTGIKGSRHVWKTLFETILFPLVFGKPLFWVIDALDECDSLSTVIESLLSIPRNLPIRVILTSRYIPSISSALCRTTNEAKVKAIEIDDNQEDILLFIQAEVVNLPGDSTFHASVVRQLVERTQGNFLWVRLAIQELQKIHSQDDLGQILDEMPVGMDSMYRRMETPIRQLSKETDKSLAQIIFNWAVWGKRPLHVNELQRVLKPRFPSLLNLRSSINQLCGYFVTVDPAGRVALIHATARDYLRSCADLPFSIEPRSSHAELFGTCMHELLDPRLRSRLTQNIMPVFCEYACTAWPYHLDRASVDADDTLSLIVKFLGGPFVLPWIEALALSQNLSSVINAAGTLNAFVQRRRKHDAQRSPLLHRLSDLRLLELWAVDLVKITGKFGSQLLQDSSVIYKFIPAMSPLNSLVHQQFRKSSLSQISISGLSTLDWDDLSSRLSIGSSHQATSIRCSARHLAIATSANTVVLWNTVSLDEVLILHQGERVLQMSFNSAGNKLVTYGLGRTRMWEIPSGRELIEVSNMINERPLALQFAKQDTTLLMCSDIRVFRELQLDSPADNWSATYTSVFQGEESVKDAFRNTPSSLSLNNDGFQVAVAYRGAPLEIWDLESGELVRRCRRITGNKSKSQQFWTGVNHVLWHPVEYETLGLYTDGTVFKWHPLTEAHLELPDIQSNSPSDVQIAPTGNVFLTSNVDGTVKIYSYYDFAPMYQLTSEDVVTAICFSPDCRRFYDLRGSYCNVWEPNVLIRLTESGDQSSDVESDIRSMSSISMVVSEAQADCSATITCLSVNSEDSLACVGDDKGNVTLFHMKSDTTMQIRSSPVGMGVERIIWSENGEIIAIEDLGRRLLAAKVSRSVDSKSGFLYKTETILNDKISLKGDLTKQIVMDSRASRILAVGMEDAQLWNLESRSFIKFLAVSTSIQHWFNHPGDTSLLLAFSQNKVSAFSWDELIHNESCNWELALQTGPARDKEQLSHLDKMLSGDLVSLEYSKQGHSNTEAPKVRFVRSSSFGSTRTEVPVFELPSDVASLVERPVNVLGQDLFVFIDKSLWVCTWRLQLENRSSFEERPTASQSKPLDAETFGRLGVNRHFFLPRDWVTASSLALCRILNDGTFLCPRKGEVAMIRSGLGSE